MASVDAGDLTQGLMEKASSSLCMYSSRFGALVSRSTEEGDIYIFAINWPTNKQTPRDMRGLSGQILSLLLLSYLISSQSYRGFRSFVIETGAKVINLPK